MFTVVGEALLDLIEDTPQSTVASPGGSPCNVAVALGNWGSPKAVPALAVALNDEESLVRGHAVWALGRIGSERATQALSSRLEAESDRWVREEIALALEAATA